MRPNGWQIRQLHRENMNWPVALVDVPREAWPDPASNPYQTGSICERVMRSRKFLVVQWLETNGARRLSVMRTEYGRNGQPLDGITWDDLQRLKREAGYGGACAIDIFPPDSDLVNVANMRHLFIVNAPPCMWRKRDFMPMRGFTREEFDREYPSDNGAAGGMK